MAVRISTGLRNKSLDSGFADAFDTTGRINIYTGSQPATPETAASGTLLGTLTLASDAITAAASSGVLTFAAITSDSVADNSGTAGWGRIYRTSDTAPGSAGGTTDRRLDFAISTSGSDVNFDDINFVAGGVIAITSLTVTLPAS